MKRLLLLPALLTVIGVFSPLQAQDSLGIRLHGREGNGWQKASEWVQSGNYAYIETGRSGLQVVDLSEPANLRNVSQNEDISDNGTDLAVSGRYIYRFTKQPEHLQVISLEDPLNPVLIEESDLPTAISSAKVSGNHLVASWYDYTGGVIADGAVGGFILYDISDPSHPQQTAYFDSTGACYTLAINADLVFLPAHHYNQEDPYRLECYDISNPENINLIGSVAHSRSQVISMAINDSIAFLGTSEVTIGVRVFDITDPANMTEITHFRLEQHGNADAPPYDLIENEGVLYVGLRRGVQLFDVSNPEDVHEYNDFYIRDGNGLKLLLVDNTLFGLMRFNLGVISLDVSNHAETQLVDHLLPDAPFGDIAANQEAIFTQRVGTSFFSDSRFQVLDYSDLENIREVFGSDTLGFYSFEIKDDYLYATGLIRFNFGLFSIDIRVPEDPQLLSQGWDPFGVPFLNRLTIHENLAVATNKYFEGVIYDIAEPDTIRGISRLDYGCGSAFYENLIYFASPNYMDSIGEIIVIDIDSLESPQEVARIGLAEPVREIVAGDGFAFASGLTGTYILDMSDPEHPSSIGFRAQYPATKLILKDELLFAVDSMNSVFRIFDVSQCELTEIGRYPLEGCPTDFAIVDSLIFVSNYTNLQILDAGEALRPYLPGIVKSTPSIPDPLSFILSAFPSPFNSTAIVRFQSPFTGNMRASLVDINGRELREYWIPASAGMRDGNRLTIDGNGLTAGTYWLRFEQNGRAATQRLVLVR